jgi:autotransporter-associated beta strand protein
MNVNVTQNATFLASGGGVLFGSNSSLNGNGTILKTGTGALVFSSTGANHTFDGTLKMEEGDLTVDSSLALATVELGTGSLIGNGTIGRLKLSQATPLNLSGGQLSIQSLEGGFDLSKTGEGILLVGNTAGFSANLSVTQGTLVVDASSSASILVNSATLGGNGTLSNVALAGTPSFDVSANKSLLISSPITGSLSFSKNGNGSLTLSNATAHSGNVTVNAGALYYASSSNSNISVQSATLGGNATLQSVSFSGASVFNVSNEETLFIESALSGSAGFAKNGNGILSIGAGAASGLSGPISLNTGVLRTLSALSSNIAIGNATISGNATLGNMTISTGASATIDAGLGQVLTLGDGSTIAGSGNFSKIGEGSFSIAGNATHTFNGTASLLSGNLIFSGNLSRSNVILEGGGISGNGTLGNISILRNATLSTTTGVTVNGSLSGTSELIKSGAGNLTLGNASGFAGSFNVLQGGLYVNSNSSAPVSLSSATLGGNGVLQAVSSNGSSTFEVAAARSLSINSSLTGGGSFVKTGTGNLTINNATGYSGTGQATAGGLVLNSAFNQSLSLSSATLGGNSVIHTLAIMGNSTVNTTQNITVSNALTGTSRLTKNGTGALILNAGVTSGFSGPITLNQGILRTFGNLTSSITIAGGTLSGNAIVSGTTSITTNGSAFDVSSGQTISINGSSARLAGNRNFSKTGSGTLAIQTSATHSYSGAATVVAGSFIISSGANLTSSTIIVDGTTAVLGGGGRLNAVALNSGKIAPSAVAATGVFTTLNATTLTWNGGTLSFRLGDAFSLTSSDRIALSGTFVKGTGSQFSFDFNGGGSSGGTYAILGFGSNSGFSTSDFTVTNLGAGLSSTFTMNSTSLVLNVVPEPLPSELIAAFGLFLLTLGFLKSRSRIGWIARIRSGLLRQ